MVTSRYRFGPNSTNTAAPALFATTVHAKYSRTWENRTPNAARVQLHRNAVAIQTCSCHALCGNDSGPSCSRTCSKCSMHKVDYLLRSIVPVDLHHLRIMDFLAWIRRRRNRNQWHIGGNDAIQDDFQDRLLLRIAAKICCRESLGTMIICCSSWRCHCESGNVAKGGRGQWVNWISCVKILSTTYYRRGICINQRILSE